jgi:hypothetical protein
MHDVSREEWEEPNYRIADHTTSKPVSKRHVDRIVIHYPGSKSVSSDPVRKIRASQRYYVTQRGYSYGYNWVIDAAGVCYQVRGLEFMSSATGGANLSTVAIQIMQPIGQEANEAQVARVRRLVADLRAWKGGPLPLVGHREAGTTPTACPGEQIFAQVKAGVFEPRTSVPPIIIDPDNEEDDMQIITPPRRLLDTRSLNMPLTAQGTVRVETGAVGATAAFVNLTVVSPQHGGFITAWSGVEDMPNVSNVNYVGAQIVCNTSWVPLAADGSFAVWSHAPTHVLVDLQAVR